METPPHESIADTVHRMEASLESLISTQFKRSATLTVLSLILLFAAYAALVLAFPRTPDERLFQRLELAHNDMSKVAQELSRGLGGTNKLSETTLKAIVYQTQAHQDALAALRKQDAEPSPQGISFLQILGGSAVLALLGYLGLQRLQSLDTEMQSLRDFMFRQIKERVVESRDVLKSTISDEVDRRFDKTKSYITTVTDAFHEVVKRSKTEFQTQTTEASQRITDVQQQVTALLDKYSWLESADMRDAAGVLGALASVEQAYRAAQKFNHEQDSKSATLALDMIVSRKLIGDADDFHNAHTQAMTIKDPNLALAIINAGLDQYPDQFDLVADKAHVLLSCGRSGEAVDMIEDWRQRAPTEFFRSWRPVVFYGHALLAGELTDEAAEKLRAAYRTVTEGAPHYIKPWAEYARLEQRMGAVKKARSILVRGLSHNPFSQQLHYNLGELLLENGDAVEAVDHLEKALQVDYQGQYQHDVSQESVRTTLAQAYEATGDTARADRCYDIVLRTTDPEKYWHICNYAKNRRLAIVTQKALRDGSDDAARAPQTAAMSSPQANETEDGEQPPPADPGGRADAPSGSAEA